jgi:hypothetical protein
MFDGLCCGQSETKTEVVLGFQTSVSFPGCVGVNLIHCPKITQRHRRDLLLQFRKKIGMLLPTLLAEVIEKL